MLMENLSAGEQVAAAEEGGQGFVRGLIQHWSYLAERALTDVYQIPDKVCGLHHRYNGSHEVRQ